jgi:hypothetical protein
VTQESGRVARIERTFAASAEDVFDAWTTRQAATRMIRVDGGLTRNGRCWAATYGLHHRRSSIDTEERALRCPS